MHSKLNHSQEKRQPTKQEKIFVNDVTDKILLYKIYKQFMMLNSIKINNPLKKWTEDLNRHFLVNEGPSSEGYGFSSSHVWM